MYSPSIRAALEANPALAREEAARADVPVPAGDAGRALFGEDLDLSLGRVRLSVLPTPMDTHKEIAQQIETKLRDADLQCLAGYTGDAIWGAARGGDFGAVDEAIVRLDRADERARRYREATGRAKYLEGGGVHIQGKIEPRMDQEIRALAQTRGENVSQTMRFLLHAGLILADERARRYEAAVIREVYGKAHAAPDPVAAIAAIGPDHYLDPNRPLDRAARTIDPFFGAPVPVREFVALEGQPPKKESWY